MCTRAVIELMTGSTPGIAEILWHYKLEILLPTPNIEIGEGLEKTSYLVARPADFTQFWDKYLNWNFMLFKERDREFKERNDSIRYGIDSPIFISYYILVVLV
jgi:hypothetical protein